MISVRQLEAGDDVSKFNSGNDQLDRWLKRNGQGNQHRFGVTYVAVDDREIVGFVTVSASSIERARIGGGGPSSWPVLLLGRMAVVKSRQRTDQRIGTLLLKLVFTLAVQQHLTVGCSAVVVDSKPESIGFYGHYDFIPTVISDGGGAAQTQMYIAIETLLTAMEQPA